MTVKEKPETWEQIFKRVINEVFLGSSGEDSQVDSQVRPEVQPEVTEPHGGES
jgi:hypothetical protein